MVLVIRIVRLGVVRLVSRASLSTARRRASRDLCCFLTVGLAFRVIGLALSREGMPITPIALSMVLSAVDVEEVSQSIVVEDVV